MEIEAYDRETLAAGMQTEWVGRQICFFESTDSTNVQAKTGAESGAAHGTLYVADTQTAGRGRRGRSWSSPAGANLYFTLLLRPDFEPDIAPMLTLVMAHSVAAATAEVTGVKTGIKWPNDIVVNGKKIVGILTEMSVEQGAIRHVVIGVGINVHRQDFASEIADKATFLDAQVPQKVDRRILLAAVAKQFEADYAQFVRSKDLSQLRDSYQAMLVNRDREVCVLDPAGEYRGIARGITDRGELIVELSDGSRRMVYAGEVSVRGILGYV